MTSYAQVQTERVDGTGTALELPTPGAPVLTVGACPAAVLLERVGSVLAAGGDVAESLQSIAELTAAVLDAGAVLRVLTPDLRAAEHFVVGYADQRARTELEDFFRPLVPGCPQDADGVEDVLSRGQISSSSGPNGSHDEQRRRLGGWIPDDAGHYILAPLRDAGTVVGVFGVHRPGSDSPFSAADGEVVQLLADGVGTTVGRARWRLDQDRAHQQRLLELREQHRELVDRLAGMESRERARIGDEIHDEPLQLVVAALLSVDNMIGRQSAAEAEELEQAATLLETAVERLRRLIGVALAPPDLSAGLGPALRDLAGSILGQGISFDLTEDPGIELTDAVTGAAYRILREALVNIRKHARAQNVTMWFRRHDNVAEITLIDDGIGARTTELAAAQPGLATMRARAEAVGGLLRIHGTAGEGTLITLSLPTRSVPINGGAA